MVQELQTAAGGFKRKDNSKLQEINATLYDALNAINGR